MDRQVISFNVNEQQLTRIGGECHYSSNKVSYIEAHFDLGANWDGFDSVRAVWFTDFVKGISTVLDADGICIVPTEVLRYKGKVSVNLVGSISVADVLTDRLTTYPAVALVVDSKAKVDSTETAPVTPSQFEQFVSIVQDAVANIKDIVSTTLNADYTLTFVYSDGTSYTTPSIRGERGPQGADGADGADGNGIASAVLNSNYTLTLTFTDGTSYTTPSIRGAQGPKGDPGDVSQAQLDAAVSDLKSDLNWMSDAVDYMVYDPLLNKSVGLTSGFTPSDIVTEYNWCCLCVPCSEGDVFRITGTGGATGRLWGFSDANGVLLSISNSGASGNDLEVIAPQNSAYFGFNSKMSVPYGVKRGYTPDSRISGLETDFNSLGIDVDAIKYDMEYVPQSINLYNPNEETSGCLTTDGTHHDSTSYKYGDFISVSNGDVIGVYGSGGASADYRFITAYDEYKNAISGEGANAQGHSFTVGLNTKYIRVTVYSSLTTPMVVKNTTPSGFVPYYPAHYKAKSAFVADVMGSEYRNTRNNKFVLSKTEPSLTDGNSVVVCSNIDNKKNDTITFYAEVNANDFDSVSVGHGYNISYGAYVKIDDTNITTYYGTDQYYQVAHGLTIDKFIYVEIEHTDNARATIRLFSSDGSYEVSSSLVAWGGSIGDVFAKSTNSTLANVKLNIAFADWLEDIYLCGDSYISLGDPKRWPYYLIANGHTKICLNGYGGVSSANEIKTFRNIISNAKPKYFIWALGMNDSDNDDSINSSYKSCLDEFIATCVANSITPILATIPNVPDRLHTYKNAYVKSLGYRYIDFAEAVGAESAGSTWYAGMLSSDNVHPTELGAKALYSRFITDMPEIVK